MKLWPFRRRSTATAPTSWDDVIPLAIPPITVEQHRAAIARIQAEQAKVVEFALPDGEIVRSASGKINIRDIQHAQGYGFVAIGYDSFGWPMGHPDSPRAATL